MIAEVHALVIEMLFRDHLDGFLDHRYRQVDGNFGAIGLVDPDMKPEIRRRGGAGDDQGGNKNG